MLQQEIVYFVFGLLFSMFVFWPLKKRSADLFLILFSGHTINVLSGLIEHCFGNESIVRPYYTFFVDIYATALLRDFVFLLSKVILEGLKPSGKRPYSVSRIL